MFIRVFAGGCIFLLLLFTPVKSLEAKEEDGTDRGMEQETDDLINEALEGAGISFEEIEESLNSSSLGGEVSFEKILRQLWKGDTGDALSDIENVIKDTLFSEISQNRKNFVQIILLAVFAALFSNIATGLFSSPLQETGFFAAYLAMAGIVLHSFFLMVSITERALAEVFSFMEAFVPAFALAITMVSGSASSIAVYEITFFLLKGCQWALKSVVLPLIQTYMMIAVINCIGETDKFSFFATLIKKGTEQILKWATGIILGLNLIQNMILPAVDSVKSTIWQKGLSAIPGAGAVISALTGSLLGASVLIKNSIGVGCLVILILLCAVPVIKLLIFMLSFFLCSAFLQPISDQRLMKLLYAAGESGKLLLQAMIACFTLFFVTIALAAISTNMRYYAG